MRLIFALFIVAFATSAAAGWPIWTKKSGSVYSHSFQVASDPTVIKDGTTYRMVVSGYGGESGDGNGLIMAQSTNGLAWTTLANGKSGVVVPSILGAWDESLELPELVKVGSEYLLFYSGYDPVANEASEGLAWGDLGLATSTDGRTFARLGAPVLTRTANWYDQDGITDATIVDVAGVLHMVYTGWCIQVCAQNGGEMAVYTLKATSTDKGRTWTKLGPLESQIPGMHQDIVLDSDGGYSVFYGVDGACSATRIGVMRARGAHPFGPFVPDAKPIFCMGTQAFETDGFDGGFPAVINDGGVGRLYYTGVDWRNFKYRIGLAESR